MTDHAALETGGLVTYVARVYGIRDAIALEYWLTGDWTAQSAFDRANEFIRERRARIKDPENQ